MQRVGGGSEDIWVLGSLFLINSMTVSKSQLLSLSFYILQMNGTRSLWVLSAYRDHDFHDTKPPQLNLSPESLSQLLSFAVTEWERILRPRPRFSQENTKPSYFLNKRKHRNLMRARGRKFHCLVLAVKESMCLMNQSAAKSVHQNPSGLNHSHILLSWKDSFLVIGFITLPSPQEYQSFSSLLRKIVCFLYLTYEDSPTYFKPSLHYL